MKTIGILGRGQLGEMLAEAADKLGLSVCFYEPATQRLSLPESRDPVATGDEALSAFIEKSDCVTFETENTPLSLAEPISKQVPVFPPIEALKVAQNRLLEKACFDELSIPTAPWMAVKSAEDLNTAADKLGYPFLLKTATDGYDGKGQFVVKTEAMLETIPNLGKQDYLAEGFVNFSRETSIIGVRRENGETAFYPLGENQHEAGILRESWVSLETGLSELQQEAASLLKKLMDHFSYVGTFTLELFQTEQGLVANEMAPRVHNTGHWTIEGAESSQFENHLRGIAAMPLGSTQMCSPAALMVNLISTIPSMMPKAEGISWHDYQKAPRANRKLGHVTVLANDLQALQEKRLALPLEERPE